MSSVTPACACHPYTALMYCPGVAGVYLLIRLGSGSRGAAWLGAVAVALVSPCNLFVRHGRVGAGHRRGRLRWALRGGAGAVRVAALLAVAWLLGRARKRPPAVLPSQFAR